MKMNRLILYRWSIALLLILNLATLLYVLGKLPNHDVRPMEGRPFMLLKKLNLSDETMLQIKEFGRLHRQEILELNRIEQEYVYKALTENENLREYENQIAIIENQKIEVTRNHFRDIEKLLDNSQKEAFISIKKDLVRSLFRSKKPEIRHPRPLK
jgi:periplasmic protein CpxP/Spy